MGMSPYGIIHFFPGGTREQYQASLKAVHPAPNVLPEGQIFHAAGASEGGFTITAIHESQASWETFRDTILLPKLQAGIAGGFTSQPVETAFAVSTLINTTAKIPEIVLT